VCRPLRTSVRWPNIARMVNRPDWREAVLAGTATEPGSGL
jgi:hypothetical protein